MATECSKQNRQAFLSIIKTKKNGSKVNLSCSSLFTKTCQCNLCIQLRMYYGAALPHLTFIFLYYMNQKNNIQVLRDFKPQGVAHTIKYKAVCR